MSYKILDTDGNPVKKGEHEVRGADIVGVVKGVDMSKRTLTITATDETEDRDGDVISAGGWDFSNYLKNPVFLWAHDHFGVPLAAAQKIIRTKSDNNPVVLQHKFPTEGLFPFADMILNLYNEKVINAGSVGFIPLEWTERKNVPAEDDDIQRRRTYGYNFVKTELLEHSGVAVPANPNAVQDSLKSMKGLKATDKQKAAFAGYLMGKQPTLKLAKKVKDSIEAELADFMEKCVVEEETETMVQVPDQIEPEEKEVSGPTDKEDSLEELLDETETPDAKDEVAEPMKAAIYQSVLILETAVSAGFEIPNGWVKVGAVLSKKNKDKLSKAAELVSEVLEDATKPEQNDEIPADQQENNAPDVETAEGGDAIEAILDGIDDTGVDAPNVSSTAGKALEGAISQLKRLRDSLPS